VFLVELAYNHHQLNDSVVGCQQTTCHNLKKNYNYAVHVYIITSSSSYCLAIIIGQAVENTDFAH